MNNKVFKQHVDQILKKTESTSREAIDDSFDFPSSSDEHHPSPDTDTSNAHYPSRDRQPPDRPSYD